MTKYGWLSLVSLFFCSYSAAKEMDQKAVFLNMVTLDDKVIVSILNNSERTIIIDSLMPENVSGHKGLTFYITKKGTRKVTSRPSVTTGSIPLNIAHSPNIELQPLRSYGRVFSVSSLLKLYDLPNGCYSMAATYIQDSTTEPLVTVSNEPIRFCHKGL
jgi:hypothetical protein